MSSGKNILVLGGNGFIGFETVLNILNNHPDTKLTLLNRGRSWDWDKEELIIDKVNTIKYNRKKSLGECQKLVKLASETRFDAVVDFSGFEPFMVEESVKLLAESTGIYIYISSDSVYEVCTEKMHSGPSQETDDKRPSNPAERRDLAEKDEYGHEKLQCEECIQKYMTGMGASAKDTDASAKGTGVSARDTGAKSKDTGASAKDIGARAKDKGVSSEDRGPATCRCVILRLADVVGARDGTERWWQYQAWTQLAALTGTRVLLPSAYKDTPLSLVYVKDVAKLIEQIIFNMSENQITSIANEPFNLACKETPTLDELVCEFHKALIAKFKDEPHGSYSGKGEDRIFDKSPEAMYEYTDSNAVPEIYPSVERGPVDVAKALTLLSWDPTPFEVVVRETVDFYDDVCEQSQGAFLEERTAIYKTLKKDLKEFYSKEQLKRLRGILNIRD